MLSVIGRLPFSETYGQPVRAYLMRRWIAAGRAVGPTPTMPAAGTQTAQGLTPEVRAAGRLVQAGRAGEAIPICRERLRNQPNDAFALHVLGLALVDQRAFDEGMESICRSVELMPAERNFRKNLAALVRRYRGRKRVEQTPARTVTGSSTSA